MVNKKLDVAYSKFYIFIGWPFGGIILLIYTIVSSNELGTINSIILIIVSLFLIIYGGWAVKRARKEMYSN